ncbi:methyltransferase domain-containing protein [Halocatena halophila]|uniref:methyltransferase domain-containing protein n=1 Tax=Halocatena halophila TaxID=2814576 RepID=UPI0038B251EA
MGGVYVLELAGEDDAFAAYEAQSHGSDVTVVAPGIGMASAIDRVETLAYTRRASKLLGQTSASIDAAESVLAAEQIDRQGTVAVRARDVRSTAGVDTQRAERQLGAILVDRGYAVDLDAPDHELRVLFSDDSCLLGWFDRSSVRDFGERKPTDRPFFQPGSMEPLLARALVNIAGAAPGQRILDPMCGTGGLLIEGALCGATVVGLDVQHSMAAGTRKNVEWAADVNATTITGSASDLPFEDDSFDGVVFDAPYGRQSKIVDDERSTDRDLERLVSQTLAEVRRIAPRVVLVADRQWNEQATDAGWSIERTFTRRVHASLDRHILVLE